MSIKVNVGIQVRVRILVLFDVIKELSIAFNFPETVIEVLKKGIVEKQILETIEAYYINSKGKAVGMVKFTIDWNKYKLYANSDYGNKIEISEEIPLIEQFALWSRDIIVYVSDMQKALGAKDIKFTFTKRKEIALSEKENREANKYLGLSPIKKRIEFEKSNNSEFKRRMRFVSEMLPELGIELESD